MTANVFPVALSIYGPPLEREIINWLKKNLPSWNKKIFDNMFSQRLSCFASYLYPEASKENLRWCMRLFICLFLLDDQLDSAEPSFAKKWLQALKFKDSNSIAAYTALAEYNRLIFLQFTSLPIMATPAWVSEWENLLTYYLEGLDWEISNKMANKKPVWEDYWPKRIHSSGVLLAFHILKLEEVKETCELLKIEELGAKLICISNDIISFPKERAIADFHNVILLSEYYLHLTENQSIELHKKQVECLTKELWELASLSKEWAPESKSWLGRFMLLLGGCLYWSEQDTLRYSTAINGQLKK
jgi:hypothetical protein